MKKTNLFLILVFLIGGVTTISAQNKTQDNYKSVGGAEHESNIYGVEIGMDIPTALQAVFVNANRQAGQEKPDALKKEGKDKKDIRVVYKNLPKGEMQIVFADGKYVSKIILNYTQQPNVDDLRLPYSSTIGDSPAYSLPGSSQPDIVLSDARPGVLAGNVEVGTYSASKTGNIGRGRSELLDGEIYDTRYSIAFTDNRKLQRIWWRDEKTPGDYKIRVSFVGKKITDAGGKFVPSIIQKTISLTDEEMKKIKIN